MNSGLPASVTALGRSLAFAAAGALGVTMTLLALAALGGDIDEEETPPRRDPLAELVVEAPPPPEPPPASAAAPALSSGASFERSASASAPAELDPNAPPPGQFAGVGGVGGPGSMAVARGRFVGPRMGAGPKDASAGASPGLRQSARARFKAPPRYPRAAREQGLEGEVLVRMRVDASGRVREVVIVRSEPPGIFDAAARAAAMNYRFDPAVEGGEAVASTVEQRIRFELR